MIKKRSFTQLQKAMSYSDFCKFCKKITEEYAKSEPQFARSYFCNAYNISESCYYKVLEHAVVTNLVEDVIVSRMMNKAVANQSIHKDGAGISSRVKYARMYTQRCEYIAMTFSEEEVKRITTDFADNPDISKVDFASMCGVARKVLELVLERAIENNIVDDDVFEAIRIRSFSKDSSKDTEDYFTTLKKKREANKKGIALE